MTLSRQPALRCLGGLLLAAGSASALSQAHVHGEAVLEIVIEPGKLSLRLETPQHNLLGHERAPRNEAERRAAAALRQRLLAGSALFALPAERGCVQAKADLEAPALLSPANANANVNVNANAKAVAVAGHADVVVSYQFDCQSTAGLKSLAVGGLFDAFPGLQRIQGQLASSAGARQVTTQRPARALAWDLK